MKIYASLIEAYIVCPRQAWLLAHKLEGNQYNEFLEIGRLIANKTYKREKKEILFDGNKIDIIKNSKDILTIIETKKSSKKIDAAKMQLLHYLYSLSKQGYNVKGEIRIPKEKIIINVECSEEERHLIKDIHKKIDELIKEVAPPKPQKIGSCRNCSYFEFCWG